MMIKAALFDLDGVLTSVQFYVCPVYNELIRAGKNVVTHDLPDNPMHSLATPEDYELFLNEFADRAAVRPRA